jgi:hypothetical protein
MTALRFVTHDDGSTGIADCLPTDAFQPGQRVWTAFFGDCTTGTVQSPPLWCASVYVLWDGAATPMWIHPGRIEHIAR